MLMFPERPVLRIFVINGTMGALLGVALASAFVFGDILGLKGIMERSIGVLAGWAMLSYVLACTFAGLAMATAIMLHWGQDDDNDDDSDGGLRSRADDDARLHHVPVRVRTSG